MRTQPQAQVQDVASALRSSCSLRMWWWVQTCDRVLVLGFGLWVGCPKRKAPPAVWPKQAAGRAVDSLRQVRNSATTYSTRTHKQASLLGEGPLKSCCSTDGAKPRRTQVFHTASACAGREADTFALVVSQLPVQIFNLCVQTVKGSLSTWGELDK